VRPRWIVAKAQGLETDVRFRKRLICNQRSFAVSVLKFSFNPGVSPSNEVGTREGMTE
jgi:hypothetical protein